MSCVKFLSDNYFDLSISPFISASSEQSAFPIENTQAKIRRSKVWRSDGYWLVTSSNNTLVFREASGGPDLTATITEGEYNETGLLMLEIKAQMEAVGVATYTVFQNDDLKIQIASNLGGGATAFELKFDSGSNTCESLLGFSNIHYTGASNYSGDYLRINTSERIVLDLGLPTNITDFAMIGFRNQSIKLSPTAVIKLEGNSSDAWTTPEYSETLNYNDNIILSISTDGLH